MKQATAGRRERRVSGCYQKEPRKSAKRGQNVSRNENAHILHDVGPHVFRESALHCAGKETVDKVVGLQWVLPFQVYPKEVGNGDLELCRRSTEAEGGERRGVAIAANSAWVGRAVNADEHTHCALRAYARTQQCHDGRTFC
mgnify:CR=1 FL=1